MGKTVRIGVVGAGFAASFHLRSYRQVQGVPLEVAAIVDIDKNMAEELARRYSVPKSYDDARYIWEDKDIEVVDLSFPMRSISPWCCKPPVQANTSSARNR